MAQVNIDRLEIVKTEAATNDPDKIAALPLLFAPTGKQLAELSRSAKCHADVFRDGAGKDALMAIVRAAQQSLPVPVPAPAQADHPRVCWRCGADDWEHWPAQALVKTVRCIRCSAKYITPKKT